MLLKRQRLSREGGAVRFLLTVMSLGALTAAPLPALAWGAEGHRVPKRMKDAVAAGKAKEDFLAKS